MRCEICGKKIMGKPLKTKIESSVMNTCKDCSKFGKVQREPPRTQPRTRNAPYTGRRSTRSREPSYEVVEDYNQIIRKAREKNGWSRDDLAEKILEKASVVNRMESGRMIPDLKLARKIERILKVTLLEKTDDTIPEDIGGSSTRGATIGDIARIKKG